MNLFRLGSGKQRDEQAGHAKCNEQQEQLQVSEGGPPLSEPAIGEGTDDTAFVPDALKSPLPESDDAQPPGEGGVPTAHECAAPAPRVPGVAGHTRAPLERASLDDRLSRLREQLAIRETPAGASPSEPPQEPHRSPGTAEEAPTAQPGDGVPGEVVNPPSPDTETVLPSLQTSEPSLPTPEPESAADRTSEAMVAVPSPTTGRAGRRAGRVRTRLLGFEHSSNDHGDVFEKASSGTAAAQGKYPVGWLVIVDGPGRGASFTLATGVSQIGRGEDQAVTLDFGDTSISRQGHAVIAYDPELRKHFLGHGGKVNIVRLNDRPVLSTEDLSDGDRIRIGETTLRFVAFCGAEFDWSEGQRDDDADAAFA